MLKAVLFDLDDTLIDWSGFNGDWQALQNARLRRVFTFLRREVHPLPDEQAYFDAFYRRTRAAWEHARQRLRAPHLGAILVEAAVAVGAPAAAPGLTAEHCLKVHQWDVIAGTTVFPDVPTGLKLLRDHNIKVGIVTNAYQPMWMRDIEMQRLGLLDYFPECRLSAADVGFIKPHPKIFESALACIGVEAHEAIFVGDNPDADIAGAQAAGLKAVLRIVSRLQPMISGLIVPDAAVHSFNELPDILDGWFPGWRA